MSNSDPNLIITTSDAGASVRTVIDVESGVTSHYQAMVLAFDDGAATLDIVTASNPYPVYLPATSQAYLRIQEIADGLTAVAGVTSMLVTFTDSAAITVDATLDAVVGISAGQVIGVYGVPGATAIGIAGVAGATAIGVTGTVGIDSAAVIGISGDVGVTGQVSIDSSSLIGISGDVGVTGEVAVVPGGASLGVTGEVSVVNGSSTLQVVSIPATGLTNGGYSGNFTVSGQRLPSHGLSSGVRIIAESTGVSTDYVYVGGTTAGGTGGMYPLREFESVFLEVNNLNMVYFWPDNTQVVVKYIGS